MLGKSAEKNSNKTKRYCLDFIIIKKYARKKAADIGMPCNFTYGIVPIVTAAKKIIKGFTSFLITE